MLQKKKWKILVTHYQAGNAIEALRSRADCEVVYNEQLRPLPKEVLMKQVRDVDVILSGQDKIDREIIDQAKQLKIVGNVWGGGRNTDRKACEEHDITLVASDVTIQWIRQSEAEHAMMLLLAVTRRLIEADAFVRAGKFTEGEQANRDMLGVGINGKTMGIIGGTNWSGSEMVKRALGFNVDIIYWDQQHGESMESLGAKYVEFDYLLTHSDFIILMANATQGYLFDKPQFDMVKRGVFLVNVTKGTFINEKELIEALKDGRVAGVGLDKLENEPVPMAGLTDLKNVVLTPHSDGALLFERNEMFRSVINKVITLIDEGKGKLA